MQQSQREAALAVHAVLGGAALPAALEANVGRDAGPARAFVQELAYGTLRHHGTLDIGISDPPTQSEVQSIMDKLNELINALRR